jgi:hypothetical protein
LPGASRIGTIAGQLSIKEREMIRTMTIAAALAMLAAPAVAQTSELRPISGTRLDVAALGEVTRVPDIVVIDAGVTTQSPTAAEAIRGNAAKMESLRSALRRAGIADRDIQTSSVNLHAEWTRTRESAPVFVGYRASHRLHVRFRDAANAGRILDTLVAAGVNEINGPTFQVEAAAAALDEARTRALEIARARADLYARSLGMRVKRILSVSETGPTGGAIMVTGYGESRASLASTNIALGEQGLGISLTVSFELE